MPSTKGYPTEEPYKLTEQLCKIGYIEIEGDPYLTADKQYTDGEIVANVQSLRNSLVLCIKALANAIYKGIWLDTEKLAANIYDTYPATAISSFFATYGIDTAEGVIN